jgi:hypothetical protein
MIVVRMVVLVAAIACFAVAAVAQREAGPVEKGLSEPSTTAPTAQRRRGTKSFLPMECIMPLNDLCHGPCPSFEEQLAKLEAAAARNCSHGHRYSVGTCGELQYLHVMFGEGHRVRYYSRDGELLAATEESDIEYIGCGSPRWGGW